MYCDNATNFVGGSSKLPELKRQFCDEYNQTELLNFLLTLHIFVASVANANLVEIEYILNSRPIAPLSEDAYDGVVLTPAYLLIGSALKTIPEKITKSPVVNYLKRYQLISHLRHSSRESSSSVIYLDSNKRLNGQYLNSIFNQAI